MQIFRCYFCNEIVECKKIAIDGKSYDICQKCGEELKDKLEGKGETALAPYYPYYYHCNHYWCNTCQAWLTGPHYHPLINPYPNTWTYTWTNGIGNNINVPAITTPSMPTITGTGITSGITYNSCVNTGMLTTCTTNPTIISTMTNS